MILKKIEENNNRENLIYKAGKYKYGCQQNETMRWDILVKLFILV